MTDKIYKLGYLAGATRFRRISEKLQTDGDKIYRDHGLNFKASWFSVFYILAASGQQKTVLELAEEIGYSHITVKNVVRELETNGLVKIKEHPTDKRSKHISLSAKGIKLLGELEKIWLPFANTLKHLLDIGHPDFLNIISRIEEELARHPINEKLKTLDNLQRIRVVDYTPSLKKSFNELVGAWLDNALSGKLEEGEKHGLYNPAEAYLFEGGFIFFAICNKKVVGCIALKRLNENVFEFTNLFIIEDMRRLGIATNLIDRCITRCKENGATQLWLQTTKVLTEANMLYRKIGFDDRKPPIQMTVLKRTEKTMVIDL